MADRASLDASGGPHDNHALLEKEHQGAALNQPALRKAPWTGRVGVASSVLCATLAVVAVTAVAFADRHPSPARSELRGLRASKEPTRRAERHGGEASDDSEKHDLQKAVVVASEDTRSHCNESDWVGHRMVCGDCRVLVSTFGDGRDQQKHRAGERRLERQGHEEHGSCKDFCHGVGRQCRGGWFAAERGSCAAIWEEELSCTELTPANQTICLCGDHLRRSQASETEEGEGHSEEHRKRGHEEQKDLVHKHTAMQRLTDHCNPFSDDTDIWSKAMLYTIPGVPSMAGCSEHCLEVHKCGAWTWGRARGIAGLTDSCFLKVVDDKGVTMHPKVGVVSALRSEKRLCSVEEMIEAAEKDKAAAEEAKEEKRASKHHKHRHHEDRAQDDLEVDLLRGVIKNQVGHCLTAVDGDAERGTVQMWTCSEDDPKQQWLFDSQSGKMQNKLGLCLDTPQRTIEYSQLTMRSCKASNWDQQWDYFTNTGVIKNWRGICVDGAEATIDGGEVFMRACEENSAHQKWHMGALSSLPQTKVGSRIGTSLYCFALMLPNSYEQGLLAMQFKHRISLFQCEKYALYSNMSIAVAPALSTGVVKSNLQCSKGGEFGTALNLPIFMAVWERVLQDGFWKSADWSVKVDPDAVFFADRLRSALSAHRETPTGVYLNNCKYGLHGPLEVFSRNAVKTWASGRQQCQDHFLKVCHGDCFWGEDLFVDQCLWKVLNVSRNNDFRLLVEDHCDPPKHWDDCKDAAHVTLHPFKDEASYLKCYRTASAQPPSAHSLIGRVG